MDQKPGLLRKTWNENFSIQKRNGENNVWHNMGERKRASWIMEQTKVEHIIMI